MRNLIRKWKYCLVLCIALLVTAGFGMVTAQASEQTAGVSITELLNDWETNGYPSYVGGVESNGTNLTIYLTEITGEHQLVLRNKISTEYTIEFKSCRYSHQDLIAAKSQITQEYLSGNGSNATGLVSVDIQCQMWPDGVKEPRLAAVAANESYNDISAKLKEKYGDMVVVSMQYSQTLPTTVPAVYPSDEGGKGSTSDVASLQSPKLKKNVIQKNKLLLKWKKVAGAGKYQIKISSTKNMKKAKSVNTKKVTYQCKINKKQTSSCYVKIRAYNKKAKQWGKWSKTIKVKRVS